MTEQNTITGLVTGLSPNGNGVVKSDGKVFFIPLAVPGQTIEFRKTHKKKRAFFGEIIKIVEQSPHTVEPFDPQFPAHGGAPWQHIDYQTQLEAKQGFVEDALRRIGGFAELNIDTIVESPVCERYRNKMEFSFGYGSMRVENDWEGNKTWYDESPGLGLHKRGSWREIVSISDTILASEKMMLAKQVAEEFALESGLPVYNPQTNKGFWRSVTVRESVRTGEMLIHFLVSEYRSDEYWQNAARKFEKRIKNITGILVSEYNGVSVPPSDTPIRTITGKPQYTEIFCGLHFSVSAPSFFQVNTPAAEKLIHTIAEFTNVQPGDHLLDLFCGTGSIGLALAKNNGVAVSGIELNEAAVEDAKINAERNKIDTAHYYAAAVEAVLPDLLEKAHFQNVVVDPPRAGLHKKARKTIAQIAVKQLIFVSCNPATLARDLLELSEYGWQPQKVRPHDLFPHTPHVETVALLTKKD